MSGVEAGDDILAGSAAGPAAVRGGALRLASFLVGALSGAGAAALLFRHLGPDRLGRYVLILSLVAIVAGLADLGLTAVGMRHASITDGDRRSLFLSDLLGLRIALTVTGVALMVLVTALSGPAIVPAGVAIAGAGLLFQVVQDNYTVVLAVQLRFGWVAAIDLLRNVGTAALIAALVVAGAGTLAFVATAIPIGIAGVVIAGLLVRSERSLRPTFDWPRWRVMVAAILPYSLAVAISTVYFRVAVVLTAILASAHELGLFNASFRAIEVLTAIPGLLAAASLPIFARAARDDMDRFAYGLGRVFDVSLIVGVWFALTLGVGAHLAMSLLGGGQFVGASKVLSVQGIALGATFVSTVGGNALLSLGLNRVILVINAGALVVSAIVIALLVPVDGGQGAAIGIAVGETGAALVSFAAIARHRAALLPSPRALPRVALAAAAGAAVGFGPPLPIVARLALSSVVYGAVLLTTHAVPHELLDAVPASWPRRSRGHTR